MSYDAFISYSHGEDSALAEAVQGGLQRFARPWYRRRALSVFRDSTGLSANPGLWSSIVDVMADTNYLVVLCSPDAAASPWVAREIEHWIETKPAGRIIPVLTAGELVWDDAAGGFDTARSTALNPALAAAFSEEPLYVDMRWAHSSDQLTLRDPRFNNSIADIAAPLHGVAKDDIVGEDIRQHRRALRLAWSGAIALVLLAIGTVAAAAVAKQNADERSKLKVSLSAAKRDLQDTLDRANQAKADLQTTQGQLTSIRDTLKKTSDSLDATNKSLQDTKNTLNATSDELSSTQGQLSSTQGQLSSTQANLKSTVGQLTSTQGQLTSTRSQLTTISNRLDASTAQLATQGAQLDKQNQQIGLQTLAIGKQQKTIDGQKVAIEKANEQLTTAQRLEKAAFDARVKADNAKNVAVAQAGAVGLAESSRDPENVASHLDLSLLLANAATHTTTTQAKVPAAAPADTVVPVDTPAAYDALLRANVESGRIRGFLHFPNREGPQALGQGIGFGIGNRGRGVATSPDGKYVAAVETSDVISVGEVHDTTRIYVWRTDDLAHNRAMLLPAMFDCVTDVRWSASDELYTVESRRAGGPTEQSCNGAVLYHGAPAGFAFDWVASRVRVWTVDPAHSAVNPSPLPFGLGALDALSIGAESPLVVSKDGRYVAISFDSAATTGTSLPFTLPYTLIRDTAVAGHDDLVPSDLGGLFGAPLDPSETKLLAFDDTRGPAVYDLTAWTSATAGCTTWLLHPTGCFTEVNPSDTNTSVNVEVTPAGSTFAATHGNDIEFFAATTGQMNPALTRSVPAGLFGYSIGDHLLAITDAHQAISVTRWDNAATGLTPVAITPTPGCTYSPELAKAPELLLVHRICTDDSNGSTLVVDTASGNVLRELQGDATFSDALRHVVTEQLDATPPIPHAGFELWDFGVGDGSGRLIASRTDRSPALSPDGRTLVAYRPHFPTSPEAGLEVWHLDARENDPELLASSTGTRGVAFVDNHTVAGVGTMGAGVLWDLDAGMQHSLFDDFHDGNASNDPQACVGPDGQINVAVDWLLRSALTGDGTIRAVSRDARTIDLVALGGGFTPNVPDLSLPSGVDRIANMRFTRNNDSLSLIVEIESIPTPQAGKPVCTSGDAVGTFVVRLRDKDGNWLSQPTKQWFPGELEAQSSSDGSRLLFSDITADHLPGTHVVMRDGTTLAQIAAFDTTALPLDHLLGSAGNIYTVNSDGSRIAGTNASGQAVVWSVPDGSVLVNRAPPTKVQPTASVNLDGISFSPNNKSVAIKTVDQRLVVWDITDPAHATSRFAQLEADAAARVVYSPDGSLVAVDALVFDATTLQSIGPRLLPASWNDPVSDVGAQQTQFVRLGDGTLLFEAVRNGGASAVSWAIDEASLQRRACDVAGRNLTEDEFAQYRLSGTYGATPCPLLAKETRDA